MKEILAVVARVKRRLDYLQFLRRTLACVFYGLLAFLAVALLEKLVYFGWDLLPIFNGFMAASLLAALALRFLRPVNDLKAALAIEEKLHLKERISSAMTLPSPEHPAAQAVIDDAAAHSRGIIPHKHFPFRLPREAKLLPLVTGAIVAALFIPWQPDVLGRHQEARKKRTAGEAVTRQLTAAGDILERKKLEARERNLKNVEKILDEYSKSLAALQDGNRDPNKAVAEMNKLIEDAEKAMADAAKNMSDLKKSLNGEGAKGLKMAENLRKEMAAGNLDKAAAEMEAMKKKIEEGTMTPEERAQLQKELAKLAKALKEGKAPAALESALSKAALSLGGSDKDAAKALEDLKKEIGKMGEMKSPEAKKMMKDLAKKLGECKKGMLNPEDGEDGGAGGQPKGGDGEKGDGKDDEEKLGDGEGAGGGGKDDKGEGDDGVGQSPEESDDPFGEWKPGDTRKEGGEGEGGGGPGIGKGGRSTEKDPGKEGFKPSTIRGQMGEGKILASDLVKGIQLKGKSQAEYEEVLRQTGVAEKDAINRERIPAKDREVIKGYFDEFQPKK